MPRAKQYLEIDVVTAARQRLNHIYDIFDNVVILFSGGKDSSCVLELARQIHEERGLGKVRAHFSDEEVLPPSNIRHLEMYRTKEWLDLRWFCFPATDYMHTLGRFVPWKRWDKDREHIRPIPEWAITPEKMGVTHEDVLEGRIGLQDEFFTRDLKGSVALCSGVRASESLVRFRSVVNKLNENYICRLEGFPNSSVRSCKPIYDWLEMDVLKFLHETGVGWCSTYESQEMAGSTLRIGPPLGAGASKRFGKIREIEPEWYEQIIHDHPEIMAQERYWEDFDVEGLVAKYSAMGWKGVLQYIEDYTDPGAIRTIAIKRYQWYKSMASRAPEEYPVELLLRETIKGAQTFKIRGLDPNAKGKRKK